MNDNIFIFDESGTILIRVKDKTIKSVDIPDGVTSIGEGAFYGCSGLTSITIPNSVTCIGDRAFAGCTSLTSIDIPNSVTSIEKRAFLGCSGLKSIYIPNNVASIGDSVFEGCSSIDSITVDKANPKYDSRENCNAILETSSNKLLFGCKNTNIPNSVTSIGEGAFYECTSLTSIKIPNGATSIEDEAFCGCSGLTSISIPNSVTSVGGWTFYGCSGLTSVNIPDSVTEIGKEAFAGCSNLASVSVDEKNTVYDSRDNCNAIIATLSNVLILGCQNTIIPESVTSIGDMAFHLCKSLDTFIIPKSVKSIGYWAFSGCTGLTSINIPNSVTSIEDGVFRDCTNLISVDIPNGLKSIGSNAFWGCKSLEKISIPISVNTIGNRAFYGCPIKAVFLPIFTKYEDDTFDEQTKVNKDKVYISYSWDGEEHKEWVRKLATDLQKKGVYVILDQWELKLGDSLTTFLQDSIANSRFVLCILTPSYKEKCDNCKGGVGYETSLIMSELSHSYLTKKFIPILRRGDYKISCPSLFDRISIDMRDDEQYEIGLTRLFSTLKNNSFTEKDSSSPLLLIDDDKTIIGVKNKSLTSINIPNSVTNISDEAFAGCTKLTSISIPNSVTYIGEGAFKECINLKNVIIPNSVINIGDCAFYDCPIDEIFIPESAKSYPNSFNERTKINKHTNDIFSPDKNQEDRLKQENESFLKFNKDGTKIIGVSNNSITSIHIPKNVTSIGDGAFKGCSELTSIDIPNNVIIIDKYAFDSCFRMTSINIPNSVTYIGEGAFYGCSSLTSIVIPDSVTRIGNGALSNCKNLESIVVDVDNQFYDSRENCNAILEKASNKLIQGCKASVIPNSVISIGNEAFKGCSGLTSVAIPDSVTNIGDGAFEDCSGLTSIDIPNSVMSIGNRAFYGCSGLISIDIGNSVTSIGDEAFYGCTGLTSINIPNSVTSIGERAFYWCTGLTSVTIPDGIKTGKNSFAHIGVFAFLQILANKLKCRYSLRKEQKKQNQAEYFIPYGTFFREEKPYIIIESMNKEQNEKYTEEELFNVQDDLGIFWSIIFKDKSIFLRPLYGEKKTPIEDVLEIANTILKGIKPVSSLSIEKNNYLGRIKESLISNLAKISENKKDSLVNFATTLKEEDIVMEEDGIYLTDAKETEFFKYLLTPVENKELWRYTTKNSLFLTLKDHNQNMLSLNCMNDISEIDYADKYIDKKTCFLKNAINEANKIFILSCCDKTKSDDLMMWRLYAEDGEGVSLCYHLDKDIDNNYFYLANICYGNHDSHPELDYLKGMMKLRYFRFHKWNVWKHFFKPYDFIYEKEIRLIYFEQDTTIANNTIWIVDNKSGIASPMKLFSLEKKTGITNSFPLSLTKVLIGPKSKEAEINCVQFYKMFSEAKIADSPVVSISKIDIYR